MFNVFLICHRTQLYSKFYRNLETINIANVILSSVFIFFSSISHTLK